MNLNIALLDTETTGLYPSSDRIIEIAVMLLEVNKADGRVVSIIDSYQELEDPGFRIPWMATAVHGITDAMVKGHAIDRARVRQILEGADLLVAHNCGFDKGFVAQLVPECKEMPWACSCRGIPWRSLFPTLSNAKLQDLADAFRLPKGAAHRAMGDVETTLELLKLLHPTGETTLLGHLIEKKLPRKKVNMARGASILINNC